MSLFSAAAVCLLAAVHPATQEPRAGGTGSSAQTDRFSVITFPTSGSPAAQPAFLRGVAALHNFEYEDANEAFKEAQQIDPAFAMAYWGEAMTYSQTLWRHEDLAAGRAALARVGAGPGHGPAASRTPKEEAYLQAARILFGDGDAAARHKRYAAAMGQIYASYAADPEIASFYALAQLGTMSRSLIGFTESHEGHSEGLAGSETQARVAAILQKVLAAHPNHPGALHYLLHNYDDPAHAHLALPAARRYATVAPQSSHALHMPSHIFLQLGMWHDAARSDYAAWTASKAWAARKGLGPAMRDYHALAWLQYELLQLGRYSEAGETLAEIDPVVKSTGSLPLLSDLSSMKARFVIESERWELMAGERNFGNVNDLFAVGASAARAGDSALADMARRALGERSKAEQEGDLRPAIAIMEQEVAALIELKAGHADRAIATLQSASAAELRLPPPLGLPVPVKPAPELLGEILIEAGRPAEAQKAFEQALARNPNRSRSVVGLARATRALGQTEAARRHYRALLANYDRADADVPEVKEARAALGNR